MPCHSTSTGRILFWGTLCALCRIPLPLLLPSTNFPPPPGLGVIYLRFISKILSRKSQCLCQFAEGSNCLQFLTWGSAVWIQDKYHLLIKNWANIVAGGGAETNPNLLKIIISLYGNLVLLNTCKDGIFK